MIAGMIFKATGLRDHVLPEVFAGVAQPGGMRGLRLSVMAQTRTSTCPRNSRDRFDRHVEPYVHLPASATQLSCVKPFVFRSGFRGGVSNRFPLTVYTYTQSFLNALAHSVHDDIVHNTWSIIFNVRLVDREAPRLAIGRNNDWSR